MTLTRATALVAFFLLAAGSPETAWPPIQPTSGTKTIVDAANERVLVAVRDPQGKVQYKLSCQSGDAEETDGFNYSGFFHCRLVSTYSQEYVPSLLFDDPHPTSDWEGRARFLLQDVVGHCARVPDWGATRTFRLRGMRIELSVRDVRLSGTEKDLDVERFTFSYAIQPDPGAKSPVSEKPATPEPAWFNSVDDSCVRERLGAR